MTRGQKIRAVSSSQMTPVHRSRKIASARLSNSSAERYRPIRNSAAPAERLAMPRA